MNNHHLINEGAQKAAIEAFLVAHEGHTQEVEVQRGTWSIYCLCKRCGEIHTYEVDNEARQQALGSLPWQEDKKLYSPKCVKLVLLAPRDGVASSLRSSLPTGKMLRKL